ncbi:MAG: NAD(P)/FAD-dependent oxidoreductase, partial [Nitrosopumilaceae archaeon]|nr:NAD(P)/FAD-dependent oxidoreductase [Nitrosopumilaceae archaeon]
AENVDSKTWWLMVGQQYSPAGYAWIFPLGGDVVRIGVGVGKPESNVDPTQRLDELIEKRVGPIGKLGNISKIEFHYGLIPNDGLSRKTVYDNLMLVGDSAGQANPLVLEGIRYAIKFGRVAGEIASKAIKKGDTSEKILSEYENNWKKSIQSKINSAGKVQNRWIELTDEQWDKELDVIKELSSEEFIDFIKADFGLSNVVKLATHHPKLAVRQLFNMVKDATKRD